MPELTPQEAAIQPPPGQTEVVAIAPPKKCSIEQVLPGSAIELLKTAPQNETIRSVVLAHLLKPIPVERQTYADIQDWIEQNIEVPKAPQAPTAPTGYSVSFEICGSDVESGTCRYTDRRSGRETITLSINTLRDLAEAVECWDELWDSITEHINVECDPSQMEMESNGEANHSHCESTDYNDFEWNYRRTSDMRAMVINLLKQHAPEAWERLSS